MANRNPPSSRQASGGSYSLGRLQQLTALLLACIAMISIYGVVMTAKTKTPRPPGLRDATMALGTPAPAATSTSTRQLFRASGALPATELEKQEEDGDAEEGKGQPAAPAPMEVPVEAPSAEPAEPEPERKTEPSQSSSEESTVAPEGCVFYSDFRDPYAKPDRLKGLSRLSSVLHTSKALSPSYAHFDASPSWRDALKEHQSKSKSKRGNQGNQSKQGKRDGFDDDDPVHVLVLTNHYYTFVAEFFRGALLNGFLPHLIGFSDAARLAMETKGISSITDEASAPAVPPRDPAAAAAPLPTEGSVVAGNSTGNTTTIVAAPSPSAPPPEPSPSPLPLPPRRRYTPDGYPVSRFDSSAPDFQWGNGKPLSWIIGPLTKLKETFGGKSLVVVADAHDSLIALPAKDLACRFRAFQQQNPGTRMLFGGERSCFPLSEEQCALFPTPPIAPHDPEAKPLPYKHVNTGGSISSIDDALAFMHGLEEVYKRTPAGSLLDSAENDQGATQLAFINETMRRQFGMAIDYEATSFFPMHMQQEAPYSSEMQWQEGVEHPGRGNFTFFCNTLTGHCPVLLHFNGGSKHLQVPIDERLLPTMATRDPALTPAIGEWLGDYELGMFSGLTLRQLVCDDRWTDDNAFNKIRPNWIPNCRGTPATEEEKQKALDGAWKAAKETLKLNKGIWG